MEAFKAKNGLLSKSFSLSDLRLTLGINENEYPVFSDFKKRIIGTAISEINEKTDLKIEEVKYGKTGRKITNVTFTVTILSKELAAQQQAKLEILQDKVEDELHPIIQQLVDLGFSEAIAKKYKTKYGVKHIERNIAYTLAKQQANLVKDIPSYLNKAIEDDLGGAWDIKREKDAEKKQKQVEIAKAKQAEDEKTKQAVKAQYTKAFEQFMALPEAQRILIKDEFMNHSDAVVVAKMKELENKGRDFFDSVIVASNFKTFLVKQKNF
jgi:plasmid replication initiation protein